MVNIDINIPVDRRTAIAAGAGLVAVVGGLAYCALRPSVKVICAESIVPAMRAVGDKCPFSLSVTPVADGDCTADKVSSLAWRRCHHLEEQCPLRGLGWFRSGKPAVDCD